MSNLNILKTEITWETTKMKFGSEIKYQNKILNHGDHLSVHKTMYVDGVYKREDLTHIPLDLIDSMIKLETTL